MKRLKHFIKIANVLDALGFYKEANEIDNLLNHADDSNEVKIYVKSVSSLTSEERNRLYSLTNSEESAMKEILGKFSNNSIAIIAKCGSNIVGWSSLLNGRAIRDDASLARLFLIGVFVEPSFRRTGIGKKLGTEAIRRAKSIRSDAVVMAQGIDDAATAFYKSLKSLRDLGEQTDKSGRTYHEFTSNADDYFQYLL